jgi:predicted Zn-dependent protease
MSEPLTTTQSVQRKVLAPPALKLPACAVVGYLGTARDALQQNQLRQAWEAALAALAVRPYHPEAYLLLGQIAAQAGDGPAASRCAKHAYSLAPAWKEARRFAKEHFGCRGTPSWLKLPPALAAEKPRISVCLIVRNEEKFLGACLASVQRVADEIIVVDSGSTDRTVEIATEHGAQVHPFDWCDDFSAARNAALLHATGDWVLMLDADETLPETSHADLLNLVAAAKVIMWRLPILDHGREEQGCSYVPRLFRNAPGLFYLDRIHEQIHASIEARRHAWGLENRLGNARLVHFGYDPVVIKQRNKVERNLRLLERAIVERPDSPNLLMNYGLELTHSGRFPEALQQYRLSFQRMSEQPDAFLVPETAEALLVQISSRLLSDHQYGEVVEKLTSPLAKRVGLNASLHFTLGLAYLRLSRFSEGEEQLLQCLAKRNQPALSQVSSGILHGGPRHCLAMCLAGQGRKKLALETCRQALAEDPESRAIRFDFARLLAEVGQPVEALQLLHTLVSEDPNDARCWQFGAVIALSHPDLLEVAVDWLAEARQHLPGNGGLIAQSAEALLLAGQFDQALPLWGVLGEGLPPKHLAARALCEICCGVELTPIAESQETPVSAEFIRWYQRLIQYQADAPVARVNGAILLLQPTLPTAARILTAAVSEAESVVA